MRKTLIFTFIALIFIYCCANNARNQIKEKLSGRANSKQTSRLALEDKLNIRNTIGVVVLNNYSKKDMVRLYNADGSLWYEFTYYYDDSDGKFEYANDDFKPFAFHQDHFLLVLKCTARTQKSFEVVVNEESGVKKYVKADDPVLRLETWETLVLSTFAV
jgi:hypothetical protein